MQLKSGTTPVTRLAAGVARRNEPAQARNRSAVGNAAREWKEAQPVAIAPGAERVEDPLVTIRYVESTPVRVLGLATGRSYDFTAGQPVLEVNAKDAAPLLNTRFFRRD